MGFLRLFLASLVLASHAGAEPLLGAMAVECFYVISGFYMQMILAEQYAAGSGWVWRFWQSRMLRIFVPYWLVLACSIAVLWMQGHLLPMQWPSVTANLAIFGTDLIRLGRVVEGCHYPLWDAIVVRPVWSVAVELLFYLIVPSLATRCSSRALLVIIGASAVGRVLVISGNAEAILRTLPCANSLLNGLFPLELGTFAAGMLAYRYFHARLKDHAQSQQYWIVQAILVSGLLLLMRCATKDATLSVMAFYGCALLVSVAIPQLFATSRVRPIDRAIGNLSYAFYLWHFVVLDILRPRVSGTWSTGLAAEALTLTLAVTSYLVLERPLDRYRHRHFRGTRQG